MKKPVLSAIKTGVSRKTNLIFKVITVVLLTGTICNYIILDWIKIFKLSKVREYGSILEYLTGGAIIFCYRRIIRHIAIVVLGNNMIMFLMGETLINVADLNRKYVISSYSRLFLTIINAVYSLIGFTAIKGNWNMILWYGAIVIYMAVISCYFDNENNHKGSTFVEIVTVAMIIAILKIGIS